jgi:S1-C subfamily serine protease
LSSSTLDQDSRSRLLAALVISLAVAVPACHVGEHTGLDHTGSDLGAHTTSSRLSSGAATNGLLPALGAGSGPYASIVPDLVDLYARVPGAVGAGTGIVLTADGEVLTNNHVISGANSIQAQDLGDGRTYPVVVLGTDPRHDVALVQLQGASGLAVAPLGDSSSIEVGQRVAAVGNAGGRGTPTISVGKVTALSQSVASRDEYRGVIEQLHGMIQVDAHIMPGDSGGPLVSDTGQVLGINTSALDAAAGLRPSGFAIPINKALAIARQLRNSPTEADQQVGPGHRNHNRNVLKRPQQSTATTSGVGLSLSLPLLNESLPTVG